MDRACPCLHGAGSGHEAGCVANATHPVKRQFHGMLAFEKRDEPTPAHVYMGQDSENSITIYAERRLSKDERHEKTGQDGPFTVSGRIAGP